MSETRTIKPRLAGGFNDYLPSDVLARRPMFAAIQATFERFGFVPLDTPCVELEEVLTGGDPNFSKHIFRLAGQGDQPLALRFDLTVPLARIVAANPTIPKPFKRYQIGQVFRGEKPQAGRYRQFTQFDADIVGSSSVLADAEIVALMYEVMTALGIRRTITRVNNRKILNGLPDYVSFDRSKIETVLRCIDKLDRDGWDAVSTELMRPPDNQFDDTALEFSSTQVERLKLFVELRAAGHAEVLSEVRRLMSGSEVAMQGVAELEVMTDFIRGFGVPDDRWSIDLSVARGLGYYTGPVFETVLLDLPEIGSVFSGGRFDDLVQRFSGSSLPATGASVGVDRLFTAMQKLNLLPRSLSLTSVLILQLDNSLTQRYVELSQRLRSEGVNTEVYLGNRTNIKGQLTYALNRGIPVVIFLGEEEMRRGIVQVKDLTIQKQTECPLEVVVPFVRSVLRSVSQFGG